MNAKLLYISELDGHEVRIYDSNNISITCNRCSFDKNSTIECYGLQDDCKLMFDRLTSNKLNYETHDKCFFIHKNVLNMANTSLYKSIYLNKLWLQE